MCSGRGGSRVANTNSPPSQLKSRDLLLIGKNLGFLVESKPGERLERFFGEPLASCQKPDVIIRWPTLFNLEEKELGTGPIGLSDL